MSQAPTAKSFNDTPGAEAATDNQERVEKPASIADLLRDLRGESQTLLRQEVALVKTEVGEKVSRATTHAIKIAIGLGVLALGGIVLLLALANLISALVDFTELIDNDWISGAIGYAIVGVITAVIGYVLYRTGMANLKNQSLTPDRTLDSLKDDKQWIQKKTT